eukprot:gene29504-biopygen16819
MINERHRRTPAAPAAGGVEGAGGRVGGTVGLPVGRGAAACGRVVGKVEGRRGDVVGGRAAGAVGADVAGDMVGARDGGDVVGAAVGSCVVGALVGTFDGVAVGTFVGTIVVGATVGGPHGTPVAGAFVGVMVIGALVVGAFDGMEVAGTVVVGEAVGDLKGTAVAGAFVGVIVAGVLVGTFDGVAVVGAVVGNHNGAVDGTFVGATVVGISVGAPDGSVVDGAFVGAIAREYTDVDVATLRRCDPATLSLGEAIRVNLGQYDQIHKLEIVMGAFVGAIVVGAFVGAIVMGSFVGDVSGVVVTSSLPVSPMLAPNFGMPHGTAGYVGASVGAVVVGAVVGAVVAGAVVGAVVAGAVVGAVVAGAVVGAVVAGAVVGAVVAGAVVGSIVVGALVGGDVRGAADGAQRACSHHLCERTSQAAPQLPWPLKQPGTVATLEHALYRGAPDVLLSAVWGTANPYHQAQRWGPESNHVPVGHEGHVARCPGDKVGGAASATQFSSSGGSRRRRVQTAARCIAQAALVTVPRRWGAPCPPRGQHVLRHTTQGSQRHTRRAHGQLEQGKGFSHTPDPPPSRRRAGGRGSIHRVTHACTRCGDDRDAGPATVVVAPTPRRRGTHQRGRAGSRAAADGRRRKWGRQ